MTQLLILMRLERRRDRNLQVLVVGEDRGPIFCVSHLNLVQRTCEEDLISCGNGVTTRIAARHDLHHGISVRGMWKSRDDDVDGLTLMNLHVRGE